MAQGYTSEVRLSGEDGNDVHQHQPPAVIDAVPAGAGVGAGWCVECITRRKVRSCCGSGERCRRDSSVKVVR